MLAQKSLLIWVHPQNKILHKNSFIIQENYAHKYQKDKVKVRHLIGECFDIAVENWIENLVVQHINKWEKKDRDNDIIDEIKQLNNVYSDSQLNVLKHEQVKKILSSQMPIFFVGWVTHQCVYDWAITAHVKWHPTYIIQDACASRWSHYHEKWLEKLRTFSTLITVDEFKNLIKNNDAFRNKTWYDNLLKVA